MNSTITLEVPSYVKEVCEGQTEKVKAIFLHLALAVLDSPSRTISVPGRHLDNLTNKQRTTVKKMMNKCFWRASKNSWSLDPQTADRRYSSVFSDDAEKGSLRPSGGCGLPEVFSEFSENNPQKA